MRKLLFPIPILLYMILLIGCTTAPLESQEPIDTIPVHVEKVVKDTFSESITLSGVTKAKQEFPVLTSTPMLVEEVYTQLGKQVNQGEPLLRFASPELDSQLSQAQKQVQLLEQTLKQTDTYTESPDGEQLSKQYQEALDRTDALIKGAQSGAVTMLNLLQASTELLLIQNQLQAFAALSAAEGRREQLVLQEYQAKQQLQALEQAKEQLVIHAPFTGIVTLLTISANDIALPQTPLIQVANLEDLLVHVQLNSTQLSQLQEGMQAKIWFESQTEAITAPLQSISVGSSVPGSAFAEIMLPNPDLDLAPGQLVKVEVETASIADALLVPVEAVTFREKDAFVYTVKDHIAQHKPVTLGSRNEQYYQVLSGLAEEDMVIVQGQERVMDGSNVDIQK